MTFPTPDELATIPVWECYVTGQMVQASLGQIPENALALGVSISELDVKFHCQMRELTEQDAADLSDIESEFYGLVGDDITLETIIEIRNYRDVRGSGRIQWFYLDRTPPPD